MPTIRVKLHSSEAPYHESPELSKRECDTQAAVLDANLCTHHERTVHPETGETVRIVHKPEAPGAPGVPVDLGWATFLSDAIDDYEIVGKES